MLSPGARDYLRRVRERLPMRGDAEERYLKQIELSLSDYCAENGPKSAREIEEAFGSPQTVVDAYLSELDTGQVIRRADIRKPVRACMLAALAAVMLAALTAGIAAFWHVEESRIVQSYDVPTYFSAEALPEEEDPPG